MSRSLMPPSFLPAGVLDKGGRDKDGLFREAERNPPAGTRLGMPFRGAATYQEATNPIRHKGNFSVTFPPPTTAETKKFIHALGNEFLPLACLQPTKIRLLHAARLWCKQ